MPVLGVLAPIPYPLGDVSVIGRRGIDKAGDAAGRRANARSLAGNPARTSARMQPIRPKPLSIVVRICVHSGKVSDGGPPAGPAAGKRGRPELADLRVHAAECHGADLECFRASHGILDCDMFAL